MCVCVFSLFVSFVIMCVWRGQRVAGGCANVFSGVCIFCERKEEEEEKRKKKKEKKKKKIHHHIYYYYY